MVQQYDTLPALEGAIAAAGAKLVVVDFYAPWCGPCRQIAPLVEKWAKEHEDVVFVKVDVDENGAAGEKFEIQAMPTFVLIKDGKVVGTVIGADPQKLLAKIKELK